MGNIDFSIEENDLKCLYIACNRTDSFLSFTEECKKSYKDYHTRNLNNISKYGLPTTFSQWINKQIIYLT